MNGYICFYNGKQCEVQANTTYDAVLKAASFWNVPNKKRYMITAVLAEKDGVTVEHTPDF